ncbi:hypothetical protein PIB30_068497 [Stylosanthes scabra]|uniref:Uncharacterized protein n=1 Tax=Stylosanthes scabra TaxID=79078 RepID=A0ABU6VLB2_9FABA|nr:hypothetical protein [Stylosanthes scabra]
MFDIGGIRTAGIPPPHWLHHLGPAVVVIPRRQRHQQRTIRRIVMIWSRSCKAYTNLLTVISGYGVTGSRDGDGTWIICPLSSLSPPCLMPLAHCSIAIYNWCLLQ